MDDKNPPVVTPPSSDGLNVPPVTTDDKGKGDGLPVKTDAEKQAEAYREQQSRADKAESQLSETDQRLAFLESVAGESMRERMTSEFIAENKDTYPDVTAEDLKELVSSPDDFERVAKHLQKKHEDIRQSTLASVREVPDQSMTEDEKTAEKAKIKPGPRSFGEFLRIQSTRTRK